MTDEEYVPPTISVEFIEEADETEDEVKNAAKQLSEALEQEQKSFLSTKTYVIVFALPAILTFILLSYYTDFNLSNISIMALAIMNGSINTIIAIHTIRLDSTSEEVLYNANLILDQMDALDETLDEAKNMVNSFTTDLDDAKVALGNVGVDLRKLDLEPVAEVVEKLKENKDGLTDILDNMRGVDIEYYIRQAKTIDFELLLAGINDVMVLLRARGGATAPLPSMPKPVLRSTKAVNRTPIGGSEDLPLDEEILEDEWGYEEPSILQSPKPLTLSRAPKRKRNLILKR